MSRRWIVAVTHGMGVQTRTEFPRTVQALRAAVERRLAERGLPCERLTWVPLHWQDEVQRGQTEYIAATKPHGLRSPGIRGFVMNYLGDPTAFRFDSRPDSVYSLVHTAIARALGACLEELADPDVGLILVAHSLGGHVLSTYVWDLQHAAGRERKPAGHTPQLEALVSERLGGVFTFGCNIPLFALSHQQVVPIDLPLRRPSGRSWWNVNDPHDVLGWPLSPFPAYRDLVHEPRVEVGGLLSSWNPLCHAMYWEDRDFVTLLTEFLSG